MSKTRFPTRLGGVNAPQARDSAEFKAALRRQETQNRALREYILRSRIQSLREVRNDLAALSAERAQDEDLGSSPEGPVNELKANYCEWHTRSSLARSQASKAHRGLKDFSCLLTLRFLRALKLTLGIET